MSLINPMHFQIKYFGLTNKFIKNENNASYEIIDGQQRILSILGFLGEDFLNEDGDRVKSEKNNFKLKDFRILSKFNGYNYTNLSDEYKNKILDFNLSIVIIDQKMNPNFDEIDLFIRLNNKPYPIRDHSFEMWNSYIDKEIISIIKENTKKHSSWFYLKSQKYNNRMDNEELYTSLVYLEHKTKIENIGDITKAKFLTIYKRENNINVRIKAKPDITKNLNIVTINDKSKIEFLKSIKNVENFIRKIKLILLNQDIDDSKKLDEYLRIELNKLFYSKSSRRTTQNFYSLWIILNDIKLEMVKKNRLDLKDEIRQIIMKMKNIPEEDDGLTIYHDALLKFKEKYGNNERRIVLSETEKNNLIEKQKNKCPICGDALFIGDEIEVDHINPLSIGGRDSFLNLQVVHKDCNRKKGANLYV